MQVRITFTPAIAIANLDGGMTEPIITTHNPDGSYAFPLLTERIAEIYSNIFDTEQITDFDYHPERVTLIVRVENMDHLEELIPRVNYDQDEGLNWGNLILDEESLLLLDLENLMSGGDIYYIPLLESYEILG